jgi:hypothetical protein
VPGSASGTRRDERQLFEEPPGKEKDMRMRTLLLLGVMILTGCKSMITLPPSPNEEWGDDVKRLGLVKADSGLWPLSLRSVPPEYTFQSALRRNAASKFGVPEPEVMLGPTMVEIGAELDGTIRDWKATAEAGQRKQTTRGDTSAALMALKKLFDAGAITQAEYEAKKKDLLGKL